MHQLPARSLYLLLLLVLRAALHLKVPVLQGLIEELACTEPVPKRGTSSEVCSAGLSLDGLACAESNNGSSAEASFELWRLLLPPDLLLMPSQAFRSRVTIAE